MTNSERLKAKREGREVAELEEGKVWWKSKTVWAGLVLVATASLKLLGVEVPEGFGESVKDLHEPLVVLVGGVMAIYGRFTAKEKIAK